MKLSRILDRALDIWAATWHLLRVLRNAPPKEKRGPNVVDLAEANKLRTQRQRSKAYAASIVNAQPPKRGA